MNFGSHPRDSLVPLRNHVRPFPKEKHVCTYIYIYIYIHTYLYIY